MKAREWIGSGGVGVGIGRLFEFVYILFIHWLYIYHHVWEAGLDRLLLRLVRLLSTCM